MDIYSATCCSFANSIMNLGGGKKLYSHVTCATDTGNIAYVFNDVCDIIIRSALDAINIVQ